MNRALLRLYALSKIPEFDNYILDLEEDLSIDNNFEEMRGQLLGDKNVLQCPNQIEYIYQLGIIRNISSVLKDEGILPDWDYIRKELEEAYKTIYESSLKVEQINDYKRYLSGKGDKQYTLQAKILIILLKKCTTVINKYFLVKVWGLPSQKLVEYIINMICGYRLDSSNETADQNEFISIEKSNPNIYVTHDIYGLEKDFLIYNLQNRLKELGEDLPSEMSSIHSEFMCIKSILLQNPSSCIRVDPSSFGSEGNNKEITKKIAKKEKRDIMSDAVSDLKISNKKNFSLILKATKKFETYCINIQDYIPKLMKEQNSEFGKPIEEKERSISELIIYLGLDEFLTQEQLEYYNIDDYKK